MAATPKTNHLTAADLRTEDERKLDGAIAEADRGEGLPMSDEEFEAIRREIEDLERRGVQGGTSPTLERRIREHRRLIEERRAAARA